MLDIFERLVLMVLGFGIGCSILLIVHSEDPLMPSNMREACQKQHNVYRCEIVAVPVPVKGE